MTNNKTRKTTVWPVNSDSRESSQNKSRALQKCGSVHDKIPRPTFLSQNKLNSSLPMLFFKQNESTGHQAHAGFTVYVQILKCLHIVINVVETYKGNIFKTAQCSWLLGPGYLQLKINRFLFIIFLWKRMTKHNLVTLYSINKLKSCCNLML